jgi:hypothetical protein
MLLLLLQLPNHLLLLACTSCLRLRLARGLNSTAEDKQKNKSRQGSSVAGT